MLMLRFFSFLTEMLVLFQINLKLNSGVQPLNIDAFQIVMNVVIDKCILLSLTEIDPN